MTKDIVIGLGEIGLPIFKLISKKFPVEGIDKIKKFNKEKTSLKSHTVDLMHICIPFSKNLSSVIKKYEESVRPMHMQFAEPSKRYADIIVTEVGYNKVAIDLIKTKIQAVLREHQ